DRDVQGAPEVVVVDELLARRFWPGENALGKRLNLIGQEAGVWSTVVGVVAHVHNAGPQEEGEPQIYMPFLQRPQSLMFVVARGAREPAALVPALRRA